MNAECNDHLVFPERNGVDECGLDLFGHYRIAVLKHADLRRCLDRNHTGQFQIIQFLLKSVAEIFEILGSLCIFGLSGHLRFILQITEFCGTYQLQLFLSSENVHGQLFKIIQVLCIHLIQNGNVFQKLPLVAVEHVTDFIDIHLCLVILRFHCIDFVRAFLKEREWSLFFFCVKRFQLCHNRGEQIADFPEIFASDVLQRFLGEVCHFLLCTGTVLQNAVCIGKINLGNKGIHHGFLFVGQNRIIHDLFLFFRLLYRKFRFRLRSAET